MISTFQDAILMEMKGITKKFPGALALDNVDFSVQRSEIHALVGENGSGKSTLIKILSGIYYPADSGRVFWEGKEVTIKNPKFAQDLGISFIYQEQQLIPFFDITSNIFLGREVVKNHLIDQKTMHALAKKVLKQIGLAIDPQKLIEDLDLNQKQKVEIAKGLSKNPQLFVLDEPTAILNYKEAEDLFRILKNLKKQGLTIIYISHRLEEIFKIADRVSILRDGKLIGTFNTCEITGEQIVQKMTGGKKILQSAVRQKEFRKIVLQVDNITKEEALKNINFKLYKGEILGIAGLTGSGTAELSRIIFGTETKDSGKIYLDSKEVKIDSPYQAMRHKLALLPEDRREEGLIINMSVSENITLTNMKGVSKLGFINHLLEKKIVKQFVNSLSIKAGGLMLRVKYLSGGNQQKVVLAKWLNSDAKIFIMVEPTHGIDVGAKSEILGLFQKLTKEGASIIFVSSEIEELVKICDRIFVIYKGKLVAKFNQEEASIEKILLYAMSGTKKQKGNI
ncbi:Ribose import ATP-binding protein RbsA [subsurface metagenome]